MSSPNDVKMVASEGVTPLPPRELLRQVLVAHIIEIPEGCELVRAAWNEGSVWPQRVDRVYRFGPPEGMKSGAGFPFFWLYAAEESFTAVWEARFCINPATHPGRFMLDTNAADGLIARMSFNCPLRLFDLSGAASSKLGIYDQLRSPDHAWCQRFGVELDQILCEHHGEVHGFVYPSRRHPGSRAYAISSRVGVALGASMHARVERFASTQDFAELVSHPCHINRDAL